MTEPRTVNELLERAAVSTTAGLRLLDRTEAELWLPWTEVVTRARRAAGGLRRLGISRGDRVALVFPTSAGFFDVFFGTLLAGAVPVPLYPPVRLGRLEEYGQRTAAMLRAVAARVVVADVTVRRLLGEAVEGSRPPLGCRTLADLERADPVSEEVAETELAMVQFSSGTTVDPKPVALSHRAVIAQTRLLNGLWPARDDHEDSGVSWLPLYHDMGLIGCVFPALERPGTLTLIPPELFVARPAVWLRTISRYRATLSPAPNFAYGLCVDRIRDDELDGADLSSWRVAMNGAEPVAPNVLRAFQERFAGWGFRAEALTPVYGLSEATLAVTFSDLDRKFTSRRFSRRALAADGLAAEDADGVELVSVGRPLPGVRLRIADAEGRALESGRVGRVMVQGPSLMEGYLGRADETRLVLDGGWLDTGDLGFVWRDELFLTGRAKDVLILRGRSHSPVEAEQAADAVEGVRTGCVVAASHMPEGAGGEELVLLVEARRDVSESDFPVIGKAVERAVLAATQLRADHVAVLAAGSLPRTSSGKLRRQEALQRWCRGALLPPAPVTPLRIAGAMARSTIAMSRAERARGRG
jgi:acyl-CoA synthetase (AMP-forming)/AMP-acid ligase II